MSVRTSNGHEYFITFKMIFQHMDMSTLCIISLNSLKCLKNMKNKLSTRLRLLNLVEMTSILLVYLVLSRVRIRSHMTATETQQQNGVFEEKN